MNVYMAQISEDCTDPTDVAAAAVPLLIWLHTEKATKSDCQEFLSSMPHYNHENLIANTEQSRERRQRLQTGRMVSVK